MPTKPPAKGLPVKGIATLLGGLVLAGAAWAAVGGSNSEKANTSTTGGSTQPIGGMITTVETTTLAESSNQISRTFVGVLKATRSSDLGFNRTGTIKHVAVDRGDVVKKDDLLIELDVRQLEAEVAALKAQKNVAAARLRELLAGPRKQTIEAARASLKALEALRDQAKLTAERQASLLKDNASSQQNVDDARQQLEAAQNRVQSQRESLDELEAGTRSEQLDAQRALVAQLEASINSVVVRVDESRLTAPYDGIISARRMDEGAIVLPGAVVMRIVEAKTTEAWVGIPTQLTGDLSKDASYVIEAGGRRLDAKFESLVPELDATTRTQTAIFSIRKSAESGSASEAIGQIVRLELPVATMSKGMWIPQTALTQATDGTWSVFIVAAGESGETIVRGQSVEVVRVDSDRVLIRGSLKPGQKIVTRGLHKLTPGQRIRTK